jgi:nucleoside-diphosphate-sugar epimerase
MAFGASADWARQGTRYGEEGADVTDVVVVTGAAGFIGSHAAHAFLDAGCRVVGIDAFTPFYSIEEKRANAAALIARPGFEMLEADVLDIDLAPVLERVSSVIHLAAQPGVTGSWGTPFATYARQNILVTQRLLEACVVAGVPRFVLASSSSVYGDAPAHPCAEDVPLHPVSPYGVTKLAAEHLCLAYGRPEVSALSVTILRLFTVYGPGQRPDMAMRRFLEAAVTGDPVTLFGDGLQTRDFTYVSDAVSAIRAAAETSLPGEVLNVGGGERVTVKAAIQLAELVTGGRIDVVNAPSRVGDVRHTGADCRRAATLLGYHPRVGLATGLACEAEWLARLRANKPVAGAAASLQGAPRLPPATLAT